MNHDMVTFHHYFEQVEKVAPDVVVNENGLALELAYHHRVPRARKFKSKLFRHGE